MIITIIFNYLKIVATQPPVSKIILKNQSDKNIAQIKSERLHLCLYKYICSKYKILEKFISIDIIFNAMILNKFYFYEGAE
jgi:hypothetical protein